MRALKQICIIFASLLLAAQIPAKAQENIRIGVLLPLTGPLAKNGLENWEAMQIARDMINERGGINGRKVEYLQGDANTPNAAISETERLITKDGVKITFVDDRGKVNSCLLSTSTLHSQSSRKSSSIRAATPPNFRL